MDPLLTLNSSRDQKPLELKIKMDLRNHKPIIGSYNVRFKKRSSKIRPKFVNKTVGIYKNKNRLKRKVYADSGSKIQLYGSDSGCLTPLDSLELEIDENILKVCKIYLKQSLFNDCKLVKLNPNYVEHIVELIFNLGFLAKRGHFIRDILDLINLLEVPECMLNMLGMNRNHRLSIFKGIAFRANLAHPNMKTELSKCKLLLIKYFSSLEDDENTETYDSFVNLNEMLTSLENLVERVSKRNVQLIVCENYVPNDVAAFLAERNISCISKVGSDVMNKLSFALNCAILRSLDDEADIDKCTGICEKFGLLRAGITVATLTFPEHFKGFTILISTRMIKSENLKRIEELIKISIVRLQGIVEELEFIHNLNGTFMVDTALCDADYEQSSFCENFSDYLDMLLGNSARAAFPSSSPRSNLNYFSCDIYYNKIVESEITCSEYRKLTRLQCFQYYTKMNELCTAPTFETVSIGNYAEGLFFSDFIKKLTNALKINKCVASGACSDSFINHQLHFETAYSNVENMRLSLTFQISSEKYSPRPIRIKTFCSSCNQSQVHGVQDLTFGKFLQLVLFNKSYRSSCNHLLFHSSKFSVLADSYSISFNLSPVSIYTVCPEFNEPLYNCSTDMIHFQPSNQTVFDKRLQILSNRVVHIINSLNHVKRPQKTLVSNLYFSSHTPLSGGLSHFYDRIFELVGASFPKLLELDIERQLPCVCKIARAHGVHTNSKSQWLCSIKNLSFSQFLSKFEKHSAFGIELNFRLHENLKAKFDIGSPVHLCESCGADSYTTLADIDTLNWFYIIVHVVRTMQSKLVKFKAGLAHVAECSEEIGRFCKCVDDTEQDLVGVFLQTMSLLLYFKYFCPRDPMYLFTVVKSFFVSFYNVFEALLDHYKAISHMDEVSSLKILEYDKHNIIVIHNFGQEALTYQKINFVDSTSALCTTSEVESMAGANSEDDIYTVYNLDEFLTFAQYFAVLSGIQDLSSDNIKKSAYFSLISRIRLNITNSQSIISLNYRPIIMPTRDVANIIANALVSKEYLEEFGSYSRLMGPNKLTSRYISYNRHFSREYEKYQYPHCTIQPELKRGLCYNYVCLGKLRRSASGSIFKSDSFPEIYTQSSTSSAERLYRRGMKLKPIYSNTNFGQESVFHKSVLSMFVDAECLSLIKTRVKSSSGVYESNPKSRAVVPFYGLPVMYANSKMLNYRPISDSAEDPNDEYFDLRFNPGKSRNYCYLSHLFIENCVNLNVYQKFLVKYILNHFARDVTKTFFDRVSANTLVSFESLLDSTKSLKPLGKSIDSADYAPSLNLEGSGSKTDFDVLDVYLDPYCVSVFYGWEFQKLRNKFCGDEMNFVRSLCRSTRMESIGKSGSPIFLSYDGKFTIKLINKHEIGLFLTRGTDFFSYFNKNNTLMSLPYGLFKVTHLRSNNSINCFVMQNIDYFHNHHKISFDLKGTSLKRFINLGVDGPASGDPNSSHAHASSTNSKEGEYVEHNILINNANYVLLDQNFKLYTKGCPIQLDYDSINVIYERLKNDLNFLSSINIVDYSLLLRISPSQSIITLGLIDFLRPYTWDKQIETVGKRLANIGQEPTIVSPNEYKVRFFNFIQRIFVYPFSVRDHMDSSEKLGEKPKHENINYLYRIKSYNQCELCNLTTNVYSNSHFACLKYYMSQMSPEIIQYLHLVLDKRPQTKHLAPDSSSAEGSGHGHKNGRLNSFMLNRLVSLVQSAYPSPTLNWQHLM